MENFTLQIATGADEWAEGFWALVPHFLYIWEAKPGQLPRPACTREDSDPLHFARKLRGCIFKNLTSHHLPLHCWISGSVPLQMLFPVLLATQGTAGALYCVVISSLGLLSGPFCDTGNGNYTYPFRNNTLEWVAFTVLGQCPTSNDTADDHEERVLLVLTIEQWGQVLPFIPRVLFLSPYLLQNQQSLGGDWPRQGVPMT